MAFYKLCCFAKATVPTSECCFDFDQQLTKKGTLTDTFFSVENQFF